MTVAGSAGGFKPLRQLLSDLPPQFNVAVVAMLHTGPGSLLAETLRPDVKLPIRLAESAQLLQPGHIYIPPYGTHLIVNPDARLTVSHAPRQRWFRPSADWLFESAAASFRARHIAVVLSGMMSDGVAKLREVKRAGGTVLVQLPAEAAYPDMPTAAIATGCVDHVVSMNDMVASVCGVLRDRNLRRDIASWEAPFDNCAGMA